MITMKKLAETFENGLNNAMPEPLEYPGIEFKIWANAGEYQKPVRDGNTVTHYITGNLRTSTSANDANNQLVMGINGLALDFMIPIWPPRGNASQTAEDLAKIRDGQYPFVEYVINVVNSYFKKAQSTILTDSDGSEYSIAFQAGTVIPGAVDIAAKYGNAVPLNVFIQVYFIQDGINSQDVKILVDGNYVPFQAVRLGRAAVSERDVYAGETVSKSTASSTVFSIDVDFPATYQAVGQSFLNYLLNGEANTAHFVEVKLGDGNSKLYFMAYNNVQSSATAIAVVGLSGSFLELGGSDEIFSLPSAFRTVRFTFNDSQVKNLAFTLSEECNTFISGVGAVKRSGGQVIALNANSFDYNEENDVYYVYMIVDKQVTVSNASAPFVVV